MYWPSNYYQIASGTGSSSLVTLYNTINAGRPVIVGGRNSNGWHWVLVYGYQNLNPNSPQTKNFLINDPNSTSRTTLADFLNVYPSSVVMKTYR